MDSYFDSIISEAASKLDKTELAKSIIQQLGYTEISPNQIILTDEDINKIIGMLHSKSSVNPNCTREQKGKTSSSMVAFVSGHGNDLDVATRHTIVDAVLGLEFSFPELDVDGEDINYKTGKQAGKPKIKKTSYLDILVPSVYKTEVAFRKAYETYIEKNVYLQMALGEPGPSSPMSMAETPNYLTRSIVNCLNKDVCLKGFSSSEIDIFIIANAYSLLYNSGVKNPTDCDLIEFARVIRHILRANFIDTWDEKMGDVKVETELWKKHYLKLLIETKKNIDRPKIWVLKKLYKSSFDRYYQLAPNEGEEPEYRVHVGLDIFDLRDSNGAEVVNAQGQTIVDFNKWKEDLIKEIDPEQSNINLDANNLKEPEFDFKGRFFTYVKGRFPTTGVASVVAAKNKAIRRAIRGILYSVEKAELYLSEICLLGFLLDIQLLTLYDPACRPLTHTITDETGEEIKSKMRSGRVRATVDDVYGFLDTFETQSSQVDF